MSSSPRSSGARSAGIPPTGWTPREPEAVPPRRGRVRDRGAGRAARGVAGVDGACQRPEVPAALDDPRAVPGALALLGVQPARRSEPHSDRARLRDRPRPRRPARDPAGPVALVTDRRDTPHRVVARNAAAGVAPDLDRQA